MTNVSQSDLEGYFVSDAEWIKYVTENEQAFDAWWASQSEDVDLPAE